MNPNAAFINQRVSIAWKYIRGSVYDQLVMADKCECLSNTSIGNFNRIMEYQLAISYLVLMYTEVTRNYPTPTTIEALKEKYCYDEVAKCFGCKQINLEKLASFFDLDTLVLTNTDTQTLIDLQPDNNIPINSSGVPTYAFNP